MSREGRDRVREHVPGESHQNRSADHSSGGSTGDSGRPSQDGSVSAMVMATAVATGALDSMDAGAGGGYIRYEITFLIHT